MPLSIELNYMKSSHYFFFSLGLVKQTYSENLDTFVGQKRTRLTSSFPPLYVYYNGTDVSLLSCITDIKHIVHLTNFISYINSAL